MLGKYNKLLAFQSRLAPYKLSITILLCCFFSNSQLGAQELINAKGKVTSANTNEERIGVNVLTSCNKGTITDFNGDFENDLDLVRFDKLHEAVTSAKPEAQVMDFHRFFPFLKRNWILITIYSLKI